MAVRFMYYVGNDTDQKLRARHYRIDDDTDVPYLPVNSIENDPEPEIITGSEAYVVDGGALYMFSEKKNEWIQQ